MPLTTGAATALLASLCSIDLTAVAQHGREHLGSGLAEADAEAAGTRAVRGGEIGGKRIGILVDQEIDPVLPIYGDRSRAMFEDGGETHMLELLMQFAGTTSGAANSTNSKPSMPIGLSNVVTCMPGSG